MHKKLFLMLVILGSVSLWAQDKVRLNLKEGLWETTHTMAMSGMPPIPEETLAKMPPDQRARMEQMMQQTGMGGKPSTDVSKNCITKEKLEKSTVFDDKHSDCTHTIVSSSAAHFEVKFKCDKEKMTSEGTMKVDATSTESAKGSVHIVSSGSGGHTMNVDFTFTSRYLGPACGDVK